MIICLIVSAIIGLIVAGISGVGLLGWIAGGAIFILGLPGALIGGFIFDINQYNQDRADDRQFWSDYEADIRQDKYLDIMEEIENNRSYNNINIDARSVHYHDYGDSSPKIRGRRKNS